MPDFAVSARGDWARHQIKVQWAPSGFAPPGPVLDLIERTWNDASQELGAHLFDGPLCRMESWTASPNLLTLHLSRTSYKPFLGTNGRHASRIAPYGPTAYANALGSSAAILTSDRWLVFGERGDKVALYPNCAHPFGGCLEPAADLDVSDDTSRELNEELRLVPKEITDLRCLALGMDMHLLQPELVYLAQVTLDRSQLEKRVDSTEHRGIWAVRADAKAMAQALKAARPLTPLTRLALVVYGQRWFGEVWLEHHAPG
jgi:hypothetical protein